VNDDAGPPGGRPAGAPPCGRSAAAVPPRRLRRRAARPCRRVNQAGTPFASPAPRGWPRSLHPSRTPR